MPPGGRRLSISRLRLKWQEGWRGIAQDVDAVFHIQMRRRFVQQQHFRLPGETDCQARLLKFPIAQGGNIPIPELLNAK